MYPPTTWIPVRSNGGCFTVPPQPGHAYESPPSESGQQDLGCAAGPEYKLGGTAWDGFAYDPVLDLLYFGTGNAAPYDSRQIGPSNLDESVYRFLSCGPR